MLKTKYFEPVQYPLSMKSRAETFALGMFDTGIQLCFRWEVPGHKRSATRRVWCNADASRYYVVYKWLRLDLDGKQSAEVERMAAQFEVYLADIEAKYQAAYALALAEDHDE